MIELPESLPDFENPPVVETVLSVQFEKLPGMRSVHFGLFWQRVRERFPDTQDHAALDPIIERARKIQPVQFRLQAMESLSPERVWLINSVGDELIQLQSDRFIKNWRKRDQEYPRYSKSIKPAFERDFAQLRAFVADERLGDIKINQCEVTYVNHIVSGEGWDDWSEIDKIFTVWRASAAESYPGRAEDASLRASYPIFPPDNNAQWIGRLHVDIQPAVRNGDNKVMYVMNLTARGMYGAGIEFFDIGREWIVRSFRNMTTEHMHSVWKEIKA